jgi:glutamyl-tRNA(Gln) amidotransferase subunit D
MAYSKKLFDLLKAKGIELGEGIRVDKSGIIYEGLLLPHSAGSEETLVVKLKNGYNVGVKFDEKTKIEKIAFEKPAEEKAHVVRPKEGLPKIALLSTGGTIASKVDYATGGVRAAVKTDELLESFSDVLEVANISKISSPVSEMSEDLQPKHWTAIAKEVWKELKNAEGVVVTHGTDSMHFTSAALSFMVSSNKTIAVTGAQRSPDRASSDTSMNLVCSGLFATKSKFPGTAIVMHGTSGDDFCFAHRGTKVRKLHTSRRDAFKSVNAKPLAKIFADGRIEEKNFEAKQVEEKLNAVFDDRVALVKAYPGSDPAILDWLAEKNKGIIIEAMGLGHLPTKEKSWLPHAKKLVDKGIFVGISSQTIFGRVNPLVYSNLRLLSDTGAVFLEDLLAETAYVKLGWVLAQSKSFDETKELMLKNVAGEFNARLAPEDFL